MFHLLGRPKGAAALASASALAIMVATAPAYAQEQQRSFDIPAQALSSALLEFSRQAETRVSVDANAVNGRQAPALQGAFTVSEGLDRLLASSGLTYATTESGAIIVRDPNSPTRLGDATGAAPSDVDAAMPDILVVGRRTLNTDIRRTADDAQPYVVFDAQTIERSNARSVEDFLRQQLPMNSQAASAAQDQSNQGSNVSAINLRGLGAEQTLILVDGRRAPRVQGAFVGSGYTQADINGIPLSAVERIEVLPSTASAIYGGGAVGGVINIILKRDYHGATVRVGTEGAFEGGGETTRFDLSGGLSLSRTGTQISGSLSRSESRPLLVGDNDLWRRSRELYTRNLADAPGSFQPYAGSTPNIRSAPDIDFDCLNAGGSFESCIFFSNLVLDPAFGGANLGSDHTFVPDGYSGPGADGGAALFDNAGRYNGELSDDVFGARRSLLNNPTVTSGNLSIRQELSSRFDGYLDLSASENEGHSVYTVATPYVSLPAASPNNPFQQDITVYLPLSGLERPVENRSESYSATLGFIARLPFGWSASIEDQWSLARTRSIYYSKVLSGDFYYPDLYAAMATDPSYNPVRDVRAFPLDYGPYLDEVRFLQGPFETKQNVASLRASGPLFQLPAGAARATVLLERREEDASELTFETTIVPERSQAVDTIYAEFNIPLVSASNALPLVNRLEISAALRRDQYETDVASPASYIVDAPPPTIERVTNTIQSTDYLAALRWELVEGLTLRASHATGFLPPNINQLVPTSYDYGAGSFIDPQRGNTFNDAVVTLLYGGNPDLAPEESESTSIGFIVSPASVEGLRLSIDYTEINKSGEVTSIDTFTLLGNEQSYPGRVTREPLSDADAALGYTGGRITAINTTSINIANSEIRAIDARVDFARELPFGTFEARAAITRQIELERQLLPGSVPYDLVGYADGPLEWRANAGASLTVDAWEVGWNAQYYGDYSVRVASLLPFDPAGVNDLAVLAQGSERIPSQVYHDAYVAYEFDEGGSGNFSGFRLAAGVQNLFGTEPPVVASSSIVGTYSPYGDPRLRRYWITVSKEF